MQAVLNEYLTVQIVFGGDIRIECITTGCMTKSLILMQCGISWSGHYSSSQSNWPHELDCAAINWIGSPNEQVHFPLLYIRNRTSRHPTLWLLLWDATSQCIADASPSQMNLPLNVPSSISYRPLWQSAVWREFWPTQMSTRRKSLQLFPTTVHLSSGLAKGQ